MKYSENFLSSEKSGDIKQDIFQKKIAITIGDDFRAAQLRKMALRDAVLS